ncbi:MAG: PVC-type heme-binding CxxCH protein [Verrucomicrobiota bacterium]
MNPLRFHPSLRALTSILGVGILLKAVAAVAAPVPDPAQQLAAFKVLDGYEVSLFASETNGIVKPIQIRFDPDGRLWVAGSVTYPQIVPGEPANDRIVMLEDRDHDGRADRSTVFADGLQIPTGLELGDGGVYVGAATELLFLKDTDGDGRADERRVVLSGFGTGDAHQTLNSFTWGPSGELLMSQGLHANSRVETPWGIAELRQAGVWRFWPRQQRLDAFWDGAMGAHNPFGNVFDRWGQPLVFAGNGHGIYHLTQAMIRTDHFLEQKALWNQGRKFGGADVVENRIWPAAQQGEFVAGGYLQNTVERFRVTDDGSTFRVERLAPLIETSDTSFRIVDVRFGPDGALYLCDWANPVIGHYQASFRDPARDKTHGRIWRIAPKRSGPGPGAPIPMSTRGIDELVGDLGSPDRWTRQMAHRVLAGRLPADVSAATTRWLSRAGTGASEAHLFEILGVLTDHGLVQTNLLQTLADAKAFEARAYAARVLGHWAERSSATPSSTEQAFRLAQLEHLVADPHPRVRLEAVVACSYVPDAHAVEVAAMATDSPMDSALEYAFVQCVQALKPWWRPALESGSLTFGGKANRLTAFTRADHSADTVSRAAGRLRRISEVALEDATRQELLQTVADAGDPKDLGVILALRTFSAGPVYDASRHAEWLNRLGTVSRNRGIRPDGDLDAALRPLLASTNTAVRAAALRLAGTWHLESVLPQLLASSSDPSNPLAQLGATEGLAGFDSDPAKARLIELAADPNPVPIRAAATAGLVRKNPKAAAKAAATLWSSEAGGAATTPTLLPVFLQHRDSIPDLIAALGATPPSPEAARVALQLLAASGRRDAELAAIFTRASSGMAPTRTVSPADIPVLAREVRESGNPTRGASLFLSPQLGCAQCHSVDGTPGKIGPNLSALGTSQTVEFVLGAMLEPQKEVKEGFVAFEITTRDGEAYQGYLRGETPEEVAILDHLTGQVVRLATRQVAERRQIGSLMPAGLLDTLSREEVRDLATYLSNLGKK